MPRIDVIPLYPFMRPLGEKIDTCEALYKSQGLPAVFKLTEQPEHAELDAALAERGYELIDRVSVQGRSLEELPVPGQGALLFSPELTDEWLDSFCRLNPSHNAHRGTISAMFSAPTLDRCFAQLQHDGATVACGLVVLQDGKAGLYDIVTDSNYRRQGHGEALILHLLQWAKQQGAADAYLQVVADNGPARRLYEKLGFEELYQQWYRVKRV